MATVYVNVTIGSRRTSGDYNVTVSRASAVGGDVSFVINTPANVPTKGAFLAAAKAVADHLLADTLK